MCEIHTSRMTSDDEEVQMRAGEFKVLMTQLQCVQNQMTTFLSDKSQAKRKKNHPAAKRPSASLTV